MKIVRLILIFFMLLPIIPLSFHTYSHHNIHSITNVSYNGLVNVNKGGSGSIIRCWKKDNKWHYYVLTGEHCIRHDGRKQTVEFRHYGIQGRIIDDIDIDAVLVDSSLYNDYAILHCVSDEYFTPIKCVNPSDANETYLLDSVYSVGCPSGEYTWSSKGHITTVAPRQRAGWYGHSAGIWYGNSGGPLLNDDFVQIGVNLQIKFDSNRLLPIPTMGFSLPLKTVYKHLGEKKVQKYFGFTVDKCPLRRII